MEPESFMTRWRLRVGGPVLSRSRERWVGDPERTTVGPLRCYSPVKRRRSSPWTESWRRHKRPLTWSPRRAGPPSR